VPDVKVRVIEVEGSPEELRKVPYLAEVLHLPADEVDEPEAGLPSELQSFISAETPSSSRDLVLGLAEEFASWEGVEATSKTPTGSSGTGAGYVRFNRRPQYVGAFAYLVPSRLQLRLRLPADHVIDSIHASARSVKPEDPYQLLIPIRDKTREEVTRLARTAYERSAKPPVSHTEGR
jgi:hypothetical protein